MPLDHPAGMCPCPAHRSAFQAGAVATARAIRAVATRPGSTMDAWHEVEGVLDDIDPEGAS